MRPFSTHSYDHGKKFSTSDDRKEILLTPPPRPRGLTTWCDNGLSQDLETDLSAEKIGNVAFLSTLVHLALTLQNFSSSSQTMTSNKLKRLSLAILSSLVKYLQKRCPK
jgi:hypothetical protein